MLQLMKGSQFCCYNAYTEDKVLSFLSVTGN